MSEENEGYCFRLGVTVTQTWKVFVDEDNLEAALERVNAGDFDEVMDETDTEIVSVDSIEQY